MTDDPDSLSTTAARTPPNNFEATVKPPLLPTEPVSPTHPNPFSQAKLPPTRLTVIGTAYHQSGQAGPTSVAPSYSRVLKSDEQVYHRRVTVGEGWVPLDTGWVSDASLIVVENVGVARATNPTDAERAADAGRTVVLAVAPEDQSARTHHSKGPRPDPIPFASVRVGEHVRITDPVPGGKLRVRCVAGSTGVIVTAFPA